MVSSAGAGAGHRPLYDGSDDRGDGRAVSGHSARHVFLHEELALHRARTRRGCRLADRVSPDGGNRTGLVGTVVLALPVAAPERVDSGRGTAPDRGFGREGRKGNGGRRRTVLDVETGAD